MQKKINRAFIILLFSTVIVSCGEEKDMNNYISCDNYDCIEKNKNKQGIIKGTLRPYTPVEKGKGAGTMFWDWEILLSDDFTIPVLCEDKSINLSSYNNKNILIEGEIFYGIIIGCPEGQNARGYRIDVKSIQEQTTTNKKNLW